MKRILLFFFTTITLNALSQTVVTIPQIQGTGITSPYASSLIKTTGIVTSKFIGTNKIGGYFIQDELGDNNFASSDGIFVLNNIDNINIGDKVELTGTIEEFNGRTQIKAVTSQTVLSSNNTIPITTIIFDPNNWNPEIYEGMILNFNQTLYVTKNSDLKTLGQLSLNSKRVFSPTNQFLPKSTEYYTLVTQNQKKQLTLEDGVNTANYSPAIFADANGTRRTGERVSNLVAVVDNIDANYFIYPTTKPVFFGNHRPSAPTDLGNYNIKVCATNLEYYLPFNYNGTYGAGNAIEAQKQHIKIIKGLLAIDADIYGIIEIEEGQNALSKLVDSMNVATVAGRYGFVNDGGLPSGTYIKVGFIYRKDKVTPYLNLKENTGTYSSKYRKKAQAFTLNSNNERFILSLNHFKSKLCTSSTGLDTDQGDGQSCYNATRVAESNSTISFLTSWKSYYNDNDVLIMGDLNAYAKEDPIQTLVQAGYIDLHHAYHADSSYSYVYQNEAGYLDHALANSTMKTQITGFSVFHINADEPKMFEYSGTDYQPNMYRYSDHDPVVVGLLLGSTNGLMDIKYQLKVSPTIVKDHFVISNAKGHTIQLYNSNGIFIQHIKSDSDEYTFSIENCKLANGIYILKDKDNNFVNRIVVLKN